MDERTPLNVLVEIMASRGFSKDFIEAYVDLWIDTQNRLISMREINNVQAIP